MILMILINLPFDIRPGSKVLFEFCKIYGHYQGNMVDVDEDKDKKKMIIF